MSQIKDIDGRDKPGHEPIDGSRPTTIGITTLSLKASMRSFVVWAAMRQHTPLRAGIAAGPLQSPRRLYAQGVNWESSCHNAIPDACSNSTTVSRTAVAQTMGLTVRPSQRLFSFPRIFPMIACAGGRPGSRRSLNWRSSLEKVDSGGCPFVEQRSHRDARSTSVWPKSSPLKSSGSPVILASA